MLCISGRASWGRYSLPLANRRNLQRKRSVGPIRSTPITLGQRSNLDIWQALARQQCSEAPSLQMSDLARKVEQVLLQMGASFFDEILRHSGLLRAQLEEALAELVSLGRVSSDSFTGLRALLMSSKHKNRAHRRRGGRTMFGLEDAGRWSLLDTFQQEHSEPAIADKAPGQVLDDEQLKRLVAIYLQRWGVLSRAVIDRESLAPPWRVLLPVLRRMELQGSLRGGRFIAGIGGEQFAEQDSVEALRKLNKEQQNADRPYYCVAAVDPVNLVNLLLPARKLARLAGNRVLYQGGIPVAMLEAGEVHFLRKTESDEQWSLQQMLLKRVYPPALRSYIGKH